jgi:hypothetical protein
MRNAFLLSTLVAASTSFVGTAQAQFATIPASDSPLFQSHDTMKITLEGEFKTLFAKYKSLTIAEGEQSSKAPEAWVNGAIKYFETSGKEVRLPLKIRVRGNSSKNDCDFPKLDVEINSGVDLSNTAFANARNFKIGTHCADVEGNTGFLRRLRNQAGPHREAFVYRLIEILNVPSLKARQARVNYVFTDDQNKQVLRNALFLESAGAAKRRYSAEEVAVEGSPAAQIAIKQASLSGKNLPTFFQDGTKNTDIRATLAAVMTNWIISNHDWDLRFDGKDRFGQRTWNVKAYSLKDGRQFVMPYDYDLAKFVTEPQVPFQLNHGMGSKSHIDPKYAPEVEEIRKDFLAKANEIMKAFEDVDFSYADISTGEEKIDEAGKQAMKTYLESMFKALETWNVSATN